MRLIAAHPSTEYIPLKVLNGAQKEEKASLNSAIDYAPPMTSSSNEWVELQVLNRALKEEKASSNAAGKPAALHISPARTATEISLLAFRDTRVAFIKASFEPTIDYMKKVCSR